MYIWKHASENLGGYIPNYEHWLLLLEQEHNDRQTNLLYRHFSIVWILTLIYSIFKTKMSLCTMGELTRNKLAIILILHKGVLKNLIVECLYLEQWEVPIIPEAPVKSQKKAAISVLVYLVQY